MGFDPDSEERKPLGIISGIFRALKFNAAQSAPFLKLDVSLLCLCALGFFTCKYWLIGQVSMLWPGSAFSYVFQCYFIDFMGGVAFVAYTNLLLDLVKPEARFKRFLPTVIFMLFCGLFWEGIAPLFLSNSTADPFDLIAYELGAIVYYGLNRILYHRVANFEHIFK